MESVDAQTSYLQDKFSLEIHAARTQTACLLSANARVRKQPACAHLHQLVLHALKTTLVLQGLAWVVSALLITLVNHASHRISVIKTGSVLCPSQLAIMFPWTSVWTLFVWPQSVPDVITTLFAFLDIVATTTHAKASLVVPAAQRILRHAATYIVP